jgi:hypothetical protein
LYSRFGVVRITVRGLANSNSTHSKADSRGGSRCSTTSTTAAASNPSSRLSRYISEPWNSLTDPISLHRRSPFQLQPPPGHFKGADRHVQPNDLLELLLLEKIPDQLRLSTAEVKDALGTAGLQSRHDRAKALLVQAERLLQHIFGLLGAAVVFGLLRFLVLDQPSEGFAEQAGLKFQLAPGDLFLLRVPGKPALSLGE